MAWISVLLSLSFGAEDLASEVTDQLPVAVPHLHLSIFQRENFFLLIKEDEGLRRFKIWDSD